MKRCLFSPLTLTLALVLACQARAQQESAIILGTTTSTYDSGLLDAILPRFEQASGVRVKIIAVGSGAALAMARRGDVDVVLSHAPRVERELVASGDLIEGQLLMHNDFVLLGPPQDPAGVGSCQSLHCAMRAIAGRHPFISRGDQSGTHEMELQLWRVAGLPVEDVTMRVETGQGMGGTLQVAVERQAYTLSDRGTFLSHQAASQLRIVFEGDPLLRNVYHLYLVSPARHARVRAADGRKFIAHMVAPSTQRAIGEFGRHRFGRSLFIPDAGRDSTRLHEPFSQ